MAINMAVFFENFVELYHELFHVYVDVVGTVLHQKVMMLQPQVQRKPREITNLKKLSEERWMNCGMVSFLKKCTLCSLISYNSILVKI